MGKKDIRDLDQEELEKFFSKNKLPRFRIDQIDEWMWQKGVNSFDKMSSLPKNLRSLLKSKFEIKSTNIDRKFTSVDGTIKYSFRLYDNNLIEGVLIPSKKRVTACITSQIGCSLDCAFCATGMMKLKRNLAYYEIFEQAYKLNLESIKSFSILLKLPIFLL